MDKLSTSTRPVGREPTSSRPEFIQARKTNVILFQKEGGIGSSDCSQRNSLCQTGAPAVARGQEYCLSRAVPQEEFARRVETDQGGVLMRKFFTIVLALGVLPMLACATLENQARDAAAALSGSIVAAQTKYQASCTAKPSQEICQVINRGVSGENALITAVETYCGWAVTPAPPDPTAKCVPVRSAQGALQTAIANAATLTLQIKGAL